MNPKIAYLCFCVFIGAFSSLFAQGPSKEVLQHLKKVTGLVTSERGGSATIGTAFLYPDGSGDPCTRAVTCLHVVGDADKIEIVFPDGKCTATVVRTLRAQDLALLELDKGYEARPLSLRTLEIGETPALLGYGALYSNANLRTVKAIPRDIGVSTLDDLIDDNRKELRKQISKVGCPALHAKIIDLEASLVSGVSGGPLIDYQGALVGVCNGGLEKGTTNMSWAIPSSLFAALLSSKEDTQKTARGILDLGVTFGTLVKKDAEAPLMEIEGHSFAKIRTRTLKELTRYSDDIQGLQQLKNEFKFLNPDAWEYDVYQDTSSGAIVVSPVGCPLRSVGNDIGISLDPAVYMIVRINKAADPEQAQKASIDFENTLAAPQPAGAFWFPNPAFTYPLPVNYESGMVIRRKASIMGVVNQFGQPVPPPLQLAFSTFASYNKVLLSVAARRTNLQTIGSGNATDIAWGKAVMSVHLATFPADGKLREE